MPEDRSILLYVPVSVAHSDVELPEVAPSFVSFQYVYSLVLPPLLRKLLPLYFIHSNYEQNVAYIIYIVKHFHLFFCLFLLNAVS